jgi:hypothetical protein
MGDVNAEVVESYFAAWNDFDADSRRATLEKVFAADATITDPDWAAKDRGEIIAAIGEARTKLGDLKLDLTKIISSYEAAVLYTWHLGDPQSPVATGYGVLHLRSGAVVSAFNFFG